LNWFKKPYFTCPACRKGLAGGQFASLVSDIEAALDARIDDDVRGEQGPGCCRGKHAGRE